MSAPTSTDVVDGLLVLADGTVFEGELIGRTTGTTTGEVVFNTALSGYQEIASDPSYAGQIIAFTYPHIGSYGTTPDDDEGRPACRGVIVRDLVRRPSSWRAEAGLPGWLARHEVSGIAGIDTRRLTRHVRDTGAIPGAIGPAGPDAEATLLAAARADGGTDGHDLTAEVTTTAAYLVEPPDHRFSVVAYDFGIKRTILRHLARVGCRVEVVPASTSAADVLARRPDGVFLSNGPGDPSAVTGGVDAIRGLVGEVPVFGICLGHQLLGLALGAETLKLPFGHHGGNHPVQHVATGRIEVTSQNHNYAVDPDSLAGIAEVTHRNLNDGTNEGMRVLGAPAYSVQYHPEAGPGPHDAVYLFDDFVALMEGHGPRPRRGGLTVPRRTDIETVMLIGSGPIVIGQACEFDYSGAQACKVLRAEGYRVVLVNSNPATIMTDPEFADATYVEPLDAPTLARVIARERPDVLLPTLGGQTALNLAVALHEQGTLAEHSVELIGASIDAIRTAEDRQLFHDAMTEVGLAVPPSGFAHSVDEALATADVVGYPVIVRPSFILGGKGTGIAHDRDQLVRVAGGGLDASPISEILVERSLVGWKEYELEVMRDRADNCVIVCSIENLDPMGVHTGDSITVAPAQTLSDVEYQQLRDWSFRCIRRIGVDTGGSNIQFAVDPATGEAVVIEMNPRVSRSDALASKATGFPIAKIAAKLAVGYTLDEIPNDITRLTPASFEPSIDYVVTKIPRWAFEKFPEVPGVLGTQMQSVGEVMAIGRTFPESVQKACRSLETGRSGCNADAGEVVLDALSDDELVDRCMVPTPERLYQLEAAVRRGIPIERIATATGVDPWFLDQLARLGEERNHIVAVGFAGMARRDWRRAKRLGFSDAQLAWLWGVDAEAVRTARLAAGVRPTFKTVDTSAAEFAATTPYHYSTWEDDDEVAPVTRPAVVILGAGPNRIGQGIEFDYCCVHAAYALSDAGFETVMVNCNPETVSTDYDTSDRLFFEPLTDEDVRNVCDALQPHAVIVSLGGQTPLKLAHGLERAGIRIAGTSPASIDLAEDRERFNALCGELGIPQPPGGTATGVEAAVAVAAGIGYPVLVRPSYVLGGRAMSICWDEAQLRAAMAELATAGSLGREGGLSAERPALVDSFLEDAVEVDVDAVRDGSGEVLVGGVMEHIEQAGVHSGDSACALPPQSLSREVVATIEAHTRRFAEALGVVGLLNVQYAVKDGVVHVIEANPRASRTVPFVAKATGVPLAKVAARVMLGATLAELRVEGLLIDPVVSGHVGVKEAVLPFNRFPDADSLLGPEMRSTGEVMGIDRTFGLAFAKSQAGAGNDLPAKGTVFLSLADRDKAAGLRVGRQLAELGLRLVATEGTAAALEADGVAVAQVVAKVGDRTGVDAVELLASGDVDLVVNTPRGRGPQTDGAHIRRAAIRHGVPCVTTVEAALAAVAGMEERSGHDPQVRSLQEYHRDLQLRLDL